MSNTLHLDSQLDQQVMNGPVTHGDRLAQYLYDVEMKHFEEGIDSQEGYGIADFPHMFAYCVAQLVEHDLEPVMDTDTYLELKRLNWTPTVPFEALDTLPGKVCLRRVSEPMYDQPKEATITLNRRHLFDPQTPFDRVGKGSFQPTLLTSAQIQQFDRVEFSDNDGSLKVLKKLE